jgi:hypothetical protein
VPINAAERAIRRIDAWQQRHKAPAFTVGVIKKYGDDSMYVLSFRVLTPKGVPTRDLVPGAMVGGLAWTVLQAGGALVVSHFLNSGSVYGIFGIVLSLLAWIYLVLGVTVYAAEVNVVRARRLWPRSLVQPPLTEADRAALALQPLQNQRREEQQISVTFTDLPQAGGACSTQPHPPPQPGF